MLQGKPWYFLKWNEIVLQIYKTRFSLPFVWKGSTKIYYCRQGFNQENINIMIRCKMLLLAVSMESNLLKHYFHVSENNIEKVNWWCDSVCKIDFEIGTLLFVN